MTFDNLFNDSWRIIHFPVNSAKQNKQLPVKKMKCSGQWTKKRFLFKITAVEPGYTVSEYARNVVALGKMEYQTDELFEPAGRVFRSRSMSLRAIVAGHSERLDATSAAAPFYVICWIQASAGMTRNWIAACVP